MGLCLLPFAFVSFALALLARLALFGSFGSFWLFLNIFGSFWLFLVLFGSVWLCLALVGSFWFCFGSFLALAWLLFVSFWVPGSCWLFLRVLGRLGAVLGRLGAVLGRSWADFRSPNRPKIGPKTGPRPPPRRMSQFGPFWARSWADLGSPNGPQIDQKSIKFSCLFLNEVLEPTWADLGSILTPIWERFWFRKRLPNASTEFRKKRTAP